MRLLEDTDGSPKFDVMKFLTPNGWFALRPSETEPKIKFYFGTHGKNKENVQTEKAKIAAAAEEVISGSA